MNADTLYFLDLKSFSAPEIQTPPRVYLDQNYLLYRQNYKYGVITS